MLAIGSTTKGNEMRRLSATLAAGVAAFVVSGCGANPVQLASAYDASVDTQAQALETDVLTFAAERQQNSLSPAGAYYVKSYTAFDVRLAVISLRAATDPGGTSCGEAIKLAARSGVGNGLSEAFITNGVDATAAGQSCVSLEVAQLQKQFAALQAADQSRCQTGMGACSTLFPPGTIDDFLPNHQSGKAPFVRAVMVSLESLVGFEQDLKPAAKG
jgi:hypothetical protein